LTPEELTQRKMAERDALLAKISSSGGFFIIFIFDDDNKS
jgi:hypothetical protein